MTRYDDKIVAKLISLSGVFICLDFRHAFMLASIRFWFLGSVQVLRRQDGLPQLKHFCSYAFWSLLCFSRYHDRDAYGDVAQTSFCGDEKVPVVFHNFVVRQS